MSHTEERPLEHESTNEMTMAIEIWRDPYGKAMWCRFIKNQAKMLLTRP